MPIKNFSLFDIKVSSSLESFFDNSVIIRTFFCIDLNDEKNIRTAIKLRSLLQILDKANIVIIYDCILGLWQALQTLLIETYMLYIHLK